MAVTTTGSRTMTSAEALPTLPAAHATAITLTVPLKAGISNVASALPSGPTFRIPENFATISCAGGADSPMPPPPSPPVRNWPRVADRLSIREP